MEFKLITEERFDDVIKHLRGSFFADEPLNKAAGLCLIGGGHKELEHHSYETLEHNLSLMAVNENSEIVGVCLNGVLKPGDMERSQKKLAHMDDENFKKIFDLLIAQNLKVNIFEKFNICKAFDLRMLSVDSRYRGHGIAKELVQRSEQVAKDFEFKLMKADATGIFSQKILKSHGFQPLVEQYYSKYTDVGGQPVLAVEAPHIKMQVLYKLVQ